MTEGDGALRLTLLSRHDCGLCEELRLALERWDGGRGRLAVEVVDIAADPALSARYGLRIPVLLHAGRELCAGRLREDVLDGLLARQAPASE